MMKALETIGMAITVCIVLGFCVWMIKDGVDQNKQYEQCKGKGGKYIDGVCLRPDQLIPLIPVD